VAADAEPSIIAAVIDEGFGGKRREGKEKERKG
jgi:hypothetical protein